MPCASWRVSGLQHRRDPKRVQWAPWLGETEFRTRGATVAGICRTKCWRGKEVWRFVECAPLVFDLALDERGWDLLRVWKEPSERSGQTIPTAHTVCVIRHVQLHNVCYTVCAIVIQYVCSHTVCDTVCAIAVCDTVCIVMLCVWEIQGVQWHCVWYSVCVITLCDAACAITVCDCV